MTVSIDASPYNASPANTNAQNRAVLQDAIADVDAGGGGIVVVPFSINYGYVIHDPSTHPDLSACVNRMWVEDHGPGNSYSFPAYDGSQVRQFPHTAQTSPAGHHDGNVTIKHARWSPWDIQSNTHPRPAADAPQNIKDEYERRATWGTAVDGVVTWAWGQGGRSGVEWDDYELTPFTLSVIDVRDLGLTDQTAVLQIERTNLDFSINASKFTYTYRDGAAAYNVWQSNEDVQVSTYWVNEQRSAQMILRDSANPDYLVLAIGGGSRTAWDASGNMYPCGGSMTLGKDGQRWATAYLTSSPNVSSDGRLKQDIRNLDAREADAAKWIALSMKSYRRKGSSKRSIGPIAQDIVAALKTSGLNPDDYDMVTTGEDGFLGVDLDQVAMFCIAALA